MALAMAACSRTQAPAETTAAAAPPPAPPPAEIVIPGEGITPESLTSTADGHVIIGSVGARTIWRAAPAAATAEAWIQPGTDGMQGVFGVFADDSTGTLYACSGSFGAPPAAGSPPPPPSTLHTFDLATGAPKGKYPLPDAGGFCNDIAVDAAGVYWTDADAGTIVKLAR